VKTNRQSHHSRQQGGVLAAVLILLGTLLAFALVIAAIAWWFWSSVEDFPQDATPAVVMQTRQPFVDQIDGVIVAGPSRFQVAANLENEQLPDDLLYLALVKEGEFGSNKDETMEIVKRVDWSGHSWTIVNGTGHGTLATASGERQVIVVQQDIADPEIGDHWIAFFPRDPDAAMVHNDSE